MKILIIDNAIDITGALTSISNKAYDLKDRYEFYFLVPPNEKTQKFLEDKGFKVIHMSFVEINRNILNNFIYCFALIKNAVIISKIIKKKDIKLVHTNDLFNMAPVLAKFFGDFKLVTHVRRMPESFPHLLYRMWVKIHLKMSDQIVPVSIANSKIFRDHNKVKVIYNPLPFEKKWPDYQIRIKNKIIKIIYLANYIQGKGQNHMIEVMKLIALKNKNPILEVTFAGGDMGLNKNKAYKQYLIALTKQYDIERFFTFLDYIDDTEKLLKSFDISINLSDSESLSRVSMESLYYGLPLVATDVGGTNELFQNDQSGFLVPKGDYQHMSKVILMLAANADLRKKLSENAKEYVSEKFSTDNTSRQLGKLYSRLLCDNK